MIARHARRSALLCAAVVAALTLASCTPAGTPPSGSSAPSGGIAGQGGSAQGSGSTTDPWGAGAATPESSGEGDAADVPEGSDGEPYGSEIDTDGDGSPDDASEQDSIELPTKYIQNYLGRGDSTPGPTVRAPGLTWGDRTPVRVRTLSIRQARQATDKDSVTSIDYDSPVDSNQNETMPPVAVVKIGRRTVVFTEGTSDENGTPLTPGRLRYSDGKKWKNGPQLGTKSSQMGMTLSRPLVVGQRVYWTRSELQNDGLYKWAVQSWAVGESKLRTEAQNSALKGRLTSVGSPPPGATLAAYRGRLYFALTANQTDNETPGPLVSLPLRSDSSAKPGALRWEAEEGSHPTATKAGLLYATGYADITTDFGDPAFKSLQRLEGPGKSRTVLALGREDAVWRQSAAGTGEDSLPQDFLAGPAALYGVGQDSVTLSLRGQLVTLKLSDRTGLRLVPAAKIGAIFSSLPVLCGSNLVFEMQLTVPQNGQLARSSGLWVSLHHGNGKLRWRETADSEGPSGCDGDAFTTLGVPVSSESSSTRSLGSVRLGDS